MNRLMMSALIVFGFVSTAFAGAEFSQTRNDQTLPAHCREFTLNNFRGPHKLVFFGIQGSTKKGFTHEIPITRQDGTLLWNVYKGLVQGQRNPNAESAVSQRAHLRPIVAIMNQNYKAMGFDFGKEGDVLELLTLVALQKSFSPKEYFFTGGFEYSNEGDRVLGELDILVGKRSTCEIVVVGESKLGIGALNHARSQMARFEGFLRGFGINHRNSFAPPARYRLTSRGIPYDQYGYILDYDEDVYGRGHYSYYGR